MLKENIRLWGLAFFMAMVFSPQSSGLTFVGFEPIAESDTVSQFDILAAGRWMDGQPEILFRSYGYPEPSQKKFVMGKDYLHLIQYNPPELKSEYVFTDSFDTRTIIVGDFDADGNVEVLGNQDFYLGEGTQISTLEYIEGEWKEYREIIPFDIDAHFAGDLFDDQGDDFIFAFGIDTITCDTCSYDIESSPPMGLIYGNRDGGSLKLHVDSTFHYALQSLGVSFGETTYVYSYEAVKDTASFAGGGPLFIGSIVKYRFDRDKARLEKLYYAACPYFGEGFTHQNSSSVYVRDSLIIVLDDAAMQWFVDDGESLSLSLMQYTPFECYRPLLFDIDKDGEDELICTESAVEGFIVDSPNRIIRAYRILK